MSIDSETPVPRRETPVRPRRGRAGRLLVWGALWLVLLASPGCVWLQNEFFVWDAAPPEPLPEQPATEDPRAW